MQTHEHVIQQSPRRLDQQRPSALNTPQRSADTPRSSVNDSQSSISLLLRPVPQTIKEQFMSFFNSMCASSSLCRLDSVRRHVLTLHFFSFSCKDVPCNVRAPEGAPTSAPRPQRPLHPPVLLRPTMRLPCPHQRPSRVSKSPCIFVARSSRLHSSRGTSRRSSCCPNTSTSWNGSL